MFLYGLLVVNDRTATSECMDQWTNAWTNEWTNGPINGPMDQLMDQWTSEAYDCGVSEEWIRSSNLPEWPRL